MRFAYFVVEGPHDVEAIGRVLKQYEFEKVKNLSELHEMWLSMIPRQYPPDGNIVKRIPIPTFFQKEGYSVAVHSVGGNSQLVRTLKLTLKNVIEKEGNKEPVSIGVFLDADSMSAQDCCTNICESLNDIEGFSEIRAPGEIVIFPNKRIGIHIFPNNKDHGTLEQVLIQCAEIVYPNLLIAASKYLDEVEVKYKQKWGHSDSSKVLVGCISNVLRPGKSNQVSIQDNQWISESTANVLSVKILREFICNLLDPEWLTIQ